MLNPPLRNCWRKRGESSLCPASNPNLIRPRLINLQWSCRIRSKRVLWLRGTKGDPKWSKHVLQIVSFQSKSTKNLRLQTPSCSWVCPCRRCSPLWVQRSNAAVPNQIDWWHKASAVATWRVCGTAVSPSSSPVLLLAKHCKKYT